MAATWLEDILGIRTVAAEALPAVTRRGRLRVKGTGGITVTLSDDAVDGESELTISGTGGGSSAIADEVTLTKDDNVVSVKDGGITNTQVAVGAAIAGTKISPDFGSQTIITTGGARFGATPAASGSIRLTNDFSLAWRNGANNADIVGIRVNASDQVTLGGTWVVASSSLLSAAGAVSAGATPALSGQIRIPNATDLRARNAANTNDVILVRIDSSDTVSLGDVSACGIRLTQAGVHGFRVAGVDAVTIAGSIMTVPAGAISVGANPSTTGAFRLPSQGLIAARNAANAGNVFVLSTTAADVVTVGGTGAAGVNLEVGGAQHLVLSGTPGGTGVLRVAHNKVVISALNSAGDNARNLMRWGTTTDELILGDTSYTTRVLSQALWLGNDADTWAEVNGSTNRINLGFGGTLGISFGASLAEFGAAPATSGNIRLSHAMSVQGRNNAGAADRTILRWGVSATDTINVGDSNVATVINGSSTQIQATTGSTKFEITTLSGNRHVISLFRDAALTTTQMPSLTGNGVVYWGHAATEPTTGNPVTGQILWTSAAGVRSKGPLGGFWDTAPNTRVHRQIFSGFVETTSSTANQTVLSIDTSGMGANVSGMLELYLFQTDSIGQTPLLAAVGFNRQTSTLSVGGMASHITGGAIGNWSAVASGANILVRISPPDSVNYRWDVLAIATYGNLINTDA